MFLKFFPFWSYFFCIGFLFPNFDTEQFFRIIRFQSIFSHQTGDKIKAVKPHSEKVNDIQKNENEMMFVTASKDNYSKLFDTETMQVLKEYKTERPVNSAAVSPIRDQVGILFFSFVT